jgi:hypothetical protein
VIAQPADVSWPDAVGQIAGERAKAETCVALMKKYGDDAQKARGEITYTNAKADSDAVIAALIVALSAGQTPARCFLRCYSLVLRALLRWRSCTNSRC